MDTTIRTQLLKTMNPLVTASMLCVLSEQVQSKQACERTHEPCKRYVNVVKLGGPTGLNASAVTCADCKASSQSSWS